MLNIKNVVFKKRLVKNLTKRYIKLYIVEEITSKNIVKIKLLVSMRIYLVVNISRIIKYEKLVKR